MYIIYSAMLTHTKQAANRRANDVKIPTRCDNDGISTSIARLKVIFVRGD